MDADESLAVVSNKGKEIGLLPIVHFQHAAGVEQDSVKIIQVFGVVLQLPFRQRLRIRSNHRVPQSGFAAQPLDGCHGVGYGLVTVPLFFSDHQQLLPGGAALSHDRAA